jgi:N-acetylglucosamine-6-phosphate deacetylase
MSAITSKLLFTPRERIDQPIVVFEEGRIVEVSSRAQRELPAQVLDLGDAVLVPGFVDLHIHGGAGCDVMEKGGVRVVSRFLARHGVTGYLPTTVTAPIEKTLSALDRIATDIEKGDETGARPRGIHLEGPFLSHLRRGVHPEKDLLKPSVQMFDRFWEAARGHIRMMTIAPELDGALEVIAGAASRGVLMSLGHSEASLEASRSGIEAGARHVTHTFNAMRPLDHRAPGILGVALTDARLSADIIADGLHTDPSMVGLFLRAKGPDASVLITDGLSPTGMPDGHYHLGSLEVEVKDGLCVSNGTIAGSVLTLDQAVRNVMKFARWNLQDSIALASLNPARAAGLSDVGTLKPGARADFAVVTAQGEVRQTIIGGTFAES